MARLPPYIVFGAPDLREEDIEEVARTLRSGWIGSGPRVAEFEKKMGEYVQAPYSVAVNSCTAALHLTLLAAGIGEGDEVITTPMTFCATVNAILHAGARPVFVDIDENTLNINPRLIERAITPATRAILPVHFAGRPCAMDLLAEIAKRHRLFLIEDAAHCLEGTTLNQKVGSIGDATCFSFYVTKSLTTAEGGLVATRHSEWADKIKVLALHGMDQDAWKRYSDSGFKNYDVVYPGFKCNMTDMQASLGIKQISRLANNLERRSKIWNFYNESFTNLPIITPAPETRAETSHAKHLYTIRISKDRCGTDRDSFQDFLHKKNIGTGVHYRAVFHHSYYAKTLGLKESDYPVAARVSDETLSLPLSSRLTDEEVLYISETVRGHLRA
jgi:dTDP-4-amino-4,6-dideoxygalactose transaminase